MIQEISHTRRRAVTYRPDIAPKEVIIVRRPDFTKEEYIEVMTTVSIKYREHEISEYARKLDYLIAKEKYIGKSEVCKLFNGGFFIIYLGGYNYGIHEPLPIELYERANELNEKLAKQPKKYEKDFEIEEDSL